MVGSITVKARLGNEGDVYWASPLFSLNSLGIPNPGAAYYREHLLEMRSYAHDHGKPLFVSVAGFSPAEYASLADIAFLGGADLVELNLDCPNIWHGAKQERPACFNSSLVADILGCVERMVGHTPPLAVKISPFSDPYALAEVARTIGQREVVKVVTAVNTFPNALAFGPKRRTRITPNGGLAGLGGPALRPVGLGHVQQLRALLPPRIQVIGVGGITRGEDILEYRWCGADAVQIATAYLERKEGVFLSLISEFIDSMASS